MSDFSTIVFNLTNAENELNSFKTWFATKKYIGETEIVSEIKSRPQMACLLGSVLNIPAPDLIKFELTMKGIFRTDLVLGNDNARAFGLIEFEPAEEKTLFKRGTAQYRYWGSSLEHGFGQVIDWAWVRDDHPNDTVLENSFGGKIAKSAFAVIAGRNSGMNSTMEKRRFEHRRHLVAIGGHHAQIMTYDDMVQRMEESLITAKTYI
ncbi:Shedu anti-phage system protein SduA domain-containing protein [Gluconobacter sp. Gdi]|uniref:Shedu anti-phage system protein SduA domain-containing protein n=1 Tax=Gluconobacter sp. Gdi TaxID=2691888 RepID=UPI0017793045|nr:Shedu anti-phage system protein SduA domain-containing protein [Gluconobacter sp. Gdi]GFE97971.1 hypothetical protein DmGdi_30440 [Gluconobacter sp. Gdi]